ncbi:MAG: ATP-dependent sacrificial sulfur transferase LarE [Deltaproteobacteria bacterium]|nr:ATP-dependent sacrificial sulfur transferase LarE [Deltaproteobacteria bacterium]
MKNGEPRNMVLDPAVLERKREKLMDDLSGLDTLLVAFSGGVDSAFLLSVAHEVLGEKVLGVTAASPIHPLEERETASRFAEANQIRHLVVDSEEMALPEFIENTPDRCYHCKKALIRQLTQVAEERGIRHMAHGANTDDLTDFRPGFRAAEEAGLLTPLVNAGLHKSEIRLLAKQMGLSVWDRPAAACLASRLPYGSPITERKLRMVEAAEQCLMDLGFRELRVRHHGSVARIELGGEAFTGVMDVPVREEIVKRFQALGFTHISLDLEGYVSGKMNRELV